jgi:hypothetical protein
MKKILPIIAVFLTAFTVFGQSNIIHQQDFEDGLGDWAVYNADIGIYASNLTGLFPSPDDAWVVDTLSDGNLAALSSSWYSNYGDTISYDTILVDGVYVIDTSTVEIFESANDWLISPEIILTSKNVLSWKAMAFDPAYPDGYYVAMLKGEISQSFADSNISTVEVSIT